MKEGSNDLITHHVPGIVLIQPLFDPWLTLLIVNIDEVPSTIIKSIQNPADFPMAHKLRNATTSNLLGIWEQT